MSLSCLRFQHSHSDKPGLDVLDSEVEALRVKDCTS